MAYAISTKTSYASLFFFFSPEWRSYFNIVVTNARKPGFFKEKKPFLSLGMLCIYINICNLLLTLAVSVIFHDFVIICCFL